MRFKGAQNQSTVSIRTLSRLLKETNAIKLFLLFLCGFLFFSEIFFNAEEEERIRFGTKNVRDTKTAFELRSSLARVGVRQSVINAHKRAARFVRVPSKFQASSVRARAYVDVDVDSDDFDVDEETRRGMNERFFRKIGLVPKPRFLIGGQSRRELARVRDGKTIVERRTVPEDAALPVAKVVSEELRSRDLEYVLERKVIPVRPEIAPERPRRGVKKKSAPFVPALSSMNSADNEDATALEEEEEKKKKKKMNDDDDDDDGGSVVDEEIENEKEEKEIVEEEVVVVEEEEEEEEEEEDVDVEKESKEVAIGVVAIGNEKPSPMQKAVLKAATYRLGGTKLKKLLDTEVDVFLSKSSMDAAGSDDKKISCGGKPVMQLKSYQALNEAVPELRDYIPDTDDVHTRGGLKPESKKLGRRCAVVGNSGSLLETNYGSEIDSHDAVIRFNAAPTKGFEKHVGKKTTIRVQNIDNLGWREPKDEMLVFTARDEKTFRHFAHYQKKKLAKRDDEKNHAQRVFNPEFWCHVWDWVDRRKLKPSSGFAGVIMALRTCSGKVSLYGFSHNNTRFHYFNVLDEKVTTSEVYQYHPLAEESEAFKYLGFHKKIIKKD